MRARRPSPVALTVAGSDSGGGAGIQADLKTFHTLGVFGTSAITCLTAQNPDRVSDVLAAPDRIVTAQMDRIFEAFPVAAAKTGMLYNARIIAAVAEGFARRRFARLVVDPVMVATSGAVLLKPDAIRALKRQLLPRAAVVTPNLAEVEVLWGRRVASLPEMRAAARALAETYGVPFVVKGGHLRGTDRSVDVFDDGRHTHAFSAPVVRRIRAHGAGCTFSAAIAAHLALGCPLVKALDRAKKFVSHALRHAIPLGKYRALNV